MLSFEEKLAIADTFSQLQRKDVSLGRVNYHYEQSAYEKKTVIYHLHPNGNGYVYAGELSGYDTDDRGFVNIREFGADEFHAIIGESIRSLTGSDEGAGGGSATTQEQRWTNGKKQELTVSYEEEDGMWYIFSGLNLDGAFETYEEAKEYLEQEGFSRT